MLRLVDGELLRHLPGAPGLVLVDGELYGTLSPAAGQPGGGEWTFTESLALQDSIGDRLADKLLTASLGLGNTHQHYAEVVRSDSPSLAETLQLAHVCMMGWLEKQKKASEWTECAPQAGVWIEHIPCPGSKVVMI